MAITLPNLDDRTFDELVTEGKALIPRYAPEWTNHNVSDPGIMLLELFAYLTELFLYRANRITDAQRSVFLDLITGQPPRPTGPLPSNDVLAQAISDWRRRIDRAVTCADYQTLAKSADPDHIARAQCIPDYNLQSGNPAKRSGHLSILIVPEDGYVPSDTLLQRVRVHLEPKRLLTSHLHIMGPQYVRIAINIRLTVKPHYSHEQLRQEIVLMLRRFLHPAHGGPDGMGWPSGRDVYMSELFTRVLAVPGVEMLRREGLVVEVEPGKLQKNEDGLPMSVEVRLGELVDLHLDTQHIHIENERE